MIPAGKLDDFARLIGRSRAEVHATTADKLIRGIVGPHIVAAPDPEQASMVAAVDAALTTTMRRVLHHPDFQALESLWRSVELLTRELETGPQLQIVLYDISAEELAADLSSTDVLEETGVFRLFVAPPETDWQLGPPSVLIGNYVFEQTPPHAELLGRIGKIAAAAQAPFIAAISTECLRKRAASEIHPLITQSWDRLRRQPHARFLGLTVPKFLLRWPYGPKTEPIDSFAFEEFTPQAGLKGMLWANGSILAGLLLGRTFSAQGLLGMRLGEIMTLDDVPFYYYTDADGDQVALPSTERLVSEPLAAHVVTQHFMPILCNRGRPEIRLGSFHSLGGPELAGPWSPLPIAPDERIEPSADEGALDEEEVESVEAFESQAAAEAESELDALLADLQSSLGDSADREVVRTVDEPTTATQSAEMEQASPAGSGDELDALLAALAPKEPETTVSESEMDPELAALLAEL
jgi:type VI secretion system protein ImpC